jgi:glycosyltransferase involved in cell wall biosynthesis
VRVVVNAVPVRGDSHGVVVENMLIGWDDLALGDDLHLVIRPDIDLDLPEAVTVHHVEPGKLAGSRVGAMNILVPRLCRDLGADVMLGVTPATTIAPLPCPRAFIAHDVRHELHPEQFSLKTRFLRNTSYAIGYRQASAIACVSNRTRDDLLDGHPFLAHRRVCVTPLGADHVLTWPAREPRPQYALAFGQWGNKNVDLTLDAWTLLRLRAEELPLMIVGVPSQEHEAVQARVAQLGLADMVTVRPWLSRAEFQSSFASSALVVFPSDHEGFGLPAIEAMRLGIPLVVTPDEALLETTGGLVTVMEGWTAESLARAVPKALQSTPEDLKKCIEHAAKFTWRRMASDMRSMLADSIGA